MNAFPVQQAKVQPPPLRDAILTRDRLIDWLNAKIHQRLVLVLAEAGYGKTTLLADFSRRTRLRTLWYRLDADDRDWVTVMHHLVAAGREHDPMFAPRTSALLDDTGVDSPTRDAVLDAYLRELPSLAEHGLVIILDDAHLVDDSADIKVIVRELVTRAPERTSVVIASRRAPSIPIARLRAAGEVAELRTDDLRFDEAETGRLFSETYGRPLEPDVLRDLSRRTEGWAASLQLVQAALRDRSTLEIRRFVQNLTGADHELYDYLAEEVVGELPADLQQFLMRTSLLQVVTPDLAGIVSGLSPTEVRRLTSQAERYSLLSRRGSAQRDHLRYHPLVRDFLEDRLEREPGGRAAITELHRSIGEACESGDWRTACYHFALIGDSAAVGRTIDGAVEEIIARGDVLIAEDFLRGSEIRGSVTSYEVLRSRADLQRGDAKHALDRARSAAEADPTSAVALNNLASVAMRVGDATLAWTTARQIARHPDSADIELMGRGLIALIEASVDADLRETTGLLSRLRDAQHARGHDHHEAITLLNLAHHEKVRGNALAAHQHADLAVSLLAQGDAAVEMASARAVKGWALAHEGDLDAARAIYGLALREAVELSRAEVLVEAAEMETWYGSVERAGDLLSSAQSFLDAAPALEQFAWVVSAQLAIRKRLLDDAAQFVGRFRIGEFGAVAGLKTQQLATRAHWSLLTRDPGAGSRLEEAIAHAESQGASFWVEINRLLGASSNTEDLNREVRRLSDGSSVFLSVVAERIVEELPRLGAEEAGVVRREMDLRRARWLPALREALASGSESSLPAAHCLDEIGVAEDVIRLRRFSKTRSEARDLGRSLARRVAPRVVIEDQGRVAIKVGPRRLEGTAIRRKVLTLLCFLLTRPRFSSARDEVLDALWPDSEPTVALNSLNQTVYFLRRVFEPSYREDTSPAYVRHEPDLIWLDRQLVTSRSQQCVDFIRALGSQPSPEDVDRLTSMYRGQFALDFAYEEWAVTYRDTLHASFLQVIENAVASDMATGHWERGIVMARRALAIDPLAEQVEASLVRLLRLSGAHAAAAEQYAHYSAVLKEGLGIEPPPLDAL